MPEQIQESDPIIDEILSLGVGKERPQGDPQVDAIADLVLGAGSTAEATQTMDFELGDDEISDIALRFSVARGGNLQEKAEAFREKFPDGDIRMVNVEGEPRLVFNRQQGEPMSLFDPGVTEKFEGKEILADLAEFVAEEGPAALGETVALLGTKGLSVLKLAFRLGAGTTGGELAGEGVQTLQGKQRETLEEVSGRAATKGVISAGTGLAFEGVRRVGTAAGGAVLGRIRDGKQGVGVIGSIPGAKKVLKASERLGVDPPPLTALTDQPILRRLGGLAGATMPTISRYTRDVQKQVNRVFNSLRQVPRSLKSNLPNDLAELNRVAKRKVLKKSLTELKQLGVSTTRMNKKNIADIEKAILEYDDVSTAAVNVAYKRARAIEAPTFDKSSVMNDVQLLSEGVWRPKGQTEGVRVSVPDQMKKVLKEISEAPDGIPDKVVQVGDETVTLSGTEQIRYWMRQLGDIAFNDNMDGTTRAIATQVRGQLKDVMFNPSNTNREFKRFWSEANRVAADRFETMGKIMWVELQKSDRPSAYIRKMITNGTVEDVEFLKKVMGGKFDKIRGAFFGELMEDPTKISSVLKNSNREFLNEMMTVKERNAVANLAREYDKIGRAGIDQILERQTRKRGIIKEIVNNPDTSSVASLVQMVKDNGGLRSNVGKQLRSALLDFVYSESVIEKESVKMITEKSVQATLKKMKDNGLHSLITHSDVRALIDVARVNEVVRPLMDAGVSISATETASQAKQLSLSALRHIAELIGIGNLTTSPGAIKFLIGRGMTTAERQASFSPIYSVMASLVANHNSENQMREERKLMRKLEAIASQ